MNDLADCVGKASRLPLRLALRESVPGLKMVVERKFIAVFHEKFRYEDASAHLGIQPTVN